MRRRERIRLSIYFLDKRGLSYIVVNLLYLKLKLSILFFNGFF
jgi:hypothetical protein